MGKILWILVAVALAYASYRHYNKTRDCSQRTNEASPNHDNPCSHCPTDQEILNAAESEANVERMDMLELGDVVNYFKSLHLNRDIDIPFIADLRKLDPQDLQLRMNQEDLGNGKLLCIAAYNDASHMLNYIKIIAASSIDEKLNSIIGEEKLVVLS